MASARQSKGWRLDGHISCVRWGVEFRRPQKKPRLGRRARTPSLAIESLGSMPLASVRVDGPK